MIDHPEFDDAAPAGCENVREADPNSFRVTVPPDPTPAPDPTPTPPEVTGPPPPPVIPLDTRPPKTRIAAHPRKLLKAAVGTVRVVFRFNASEGDASFRCKLDRRPFTACASPRAYRVGPGSHAVRIAAIDGSGNVDRTPALFRFRVVKR